MIHQLIRYAQDKGLVTESGFAPKNIKWAIAFRNGKFTGIIQLGDSSLKNNPGRSFVRCPDLSQPELIKTKGCHFLAESLSTITLFGIVKEGDKQEVTEGGISPLVSVVEEGEIQLDKHEVVEKGERQHKKQLQAQREKKLFFVNLLREAASTVTALGKVAELLVDSKNLEDIRKGLAEVKAKPTDKATLLIDDTFPIDDPELHEWWRKWRATNTPRAASVGMVSFVSGEVVESVGTHPTIKGLGNVGGISSGSPLIAFDKESYTSYNLVKSDNAAVSEVEAAAYRAALNDLLTRAITLEGTKVAFWYKSPEQIDIENDPIASLFDPNRRGETQLQEQSSSEKQVGKFLHSVRTGSRAGIEDSEYFAITLSGTGGRVMLRDWMQGSFIDLLRNVDAWFDDLSIVHPDGDRLIGSPKFNTVLDAVVYTPPNAKPRTISAPTASRLWRCACNDLVIPIDVMAQALRAFTLGVITDKSPNHARVGILRAYHVRRKGGTELGPYLNENHPNAAYHCGRLLAVLARLQNRALGDVESGVIQRYYASASTTPALVLGRLVKLSQFHLAKLDRGLSMYYEEALFSVWSKIELQVPKILSLEEQSLFALGYYQQMAHDRGSKKERPNIDASISPLTKTGDDLE